MNCGVADKGVVAAGDELSASVATAVISLAGCRVAAGWGGLVLEMMTL